MVGAALLDVNVLVASAYQWHVFHDRAYAWWRRSGGEAWATCPLTEAGFVRIISNPSFHPEAPSVRETLSLLAAIKERPGHCFWRMDMGLAETVKPFQQRLLGPSQVTDAYLLGLAIKNKGRLITLDRGIAALAGPAYEQHVEPL